MDCTPYYCTQNSSNKAYVRLLHAAPKAPAVDVYVNDNLIANNLSYRNFTQYFSITPGNINVKVYPAGDKTNPLINTSVTIPENTIFTIPVIGRFPNIDVLTVEDPRIPIRRTRAYVRFAHLSPNAPAVDVTFPTGTEVFADVNYREVTDYISLPPNTYTLELRTADNGEVVLYVPNITLTPNRFYTVYAIGLVNDTPPLQVLIPLDGNSYLQF